MLDACNSETTDHSAGYLVQLGLPGTHSDDQSSRGSPGFMGVFRVNGSRFGISRIFHGGVSSAGLSTLALQIRD